MSEASKLDLIRLASRTEKGLRDENQDAMTDFRTPFGAVYLVADGMGGAQGGAEASLLTAEGYRKYLTSFSSEMSNSEALQRATSATNSEIRLQYQSGDPAVAGMGSTVVLALFSEVGASLKATIAHVGDSRAYLLRQGSLHRLTRDHSTVQRLVDNDQITAEEARHHPDANVITRALGPFDEVQIDVSEEMVQAGDLLLLCSDGLCGYVDDSAIAEELSQPREIGLTAEALVALALNSGSTDNITVHVLKISDAAESAPAKTRKNLLARLISSLTGPSESPTNPVGKEVSHVSLHSVLRHGASLLLALALGVPAVRLSVSVPAGPSQRIPEPKRAAAGKVSLSSPAIDPPSTEISLPPLPGSVGAPDPN